VAELPPRAADYRLVLPDGKEYSIPAGRLTVGRQADCDLVISDPLVSRRHADLYLRDDTLYVEDLGSANGTIVNGVPLQGERSLKGGDVIEFGDTKVTVRAETPQISIALRAITPEEAAGGQVIGLDTPSPADPAIGSDDRSAAYPAIGFDDPSAELPAVGFDEPAAAHPAIPTGVESTPSQAPDPSQILPEPLPVVPPVVPPAQLPQSFAAAPDQMVEPPATAAEPRHATPAPTNSGDEQPTSPIEAVPSPIADSKSATAVPPEPLPISMVAGDARLTIRTSAPHAVPGGLAAEIALRGVLDIETADQFRDAVQSLVQAQVIYFTVSLDEVEYIDSSGLGALVGLHREVKPRSGFVELERPQPAVRSVIELTRLDRVFKIV
jgi:anti-anti-sigma factor